MANARVTPAAKPARITRMATGRPRLAIIRGMAVLLVAASLSAPAAMAQVTATDQYLARMDIDRDGRVALTEYQAWMGYAFERMDRNGDGQLTADELPGGRGAAISLSAHRETLAAAFRRQDANRDGFLSARELAAPPQ